MDEFESGGAPEEAEKDLEAEQADVAVEASEAEDAVESELPSLPKRLFDVFLSPGKVMKAIAQNPAWVGALLVGVFLIALQTALTWDLTREMMIEAQRQAALEAGREAPVMPEWFMNVLRYATPIIGMIVITLFTFFFAGVYWLIFSFVLGDEGRYRQYLAVGTHALFVPAIIGLAHRGLYANLGRDTCADKLGDPPCGKLIAEVCGVEGTLAGFVDYGLVRQRGQRGNDLATGRVCDQHTAHGSRVPDT